MLWKRLDEDLGGPLREGAEQERVGRGNASRIGLDHGLGARANGRLAATRGPRRRGVAASRVRRKRTGLRLTPRLAASGVVADTGDPICEGLPDRLDQKGRQEWLRHMGHGPDAKAEVLEDRRILPRQHDDRNRPRRRVTAKVGDGGVPVHARHHQIQHDDGRLPSEGHLDGFRAVRGQGGVESRVGEHDLDKLAGLGLVVHHEHQRGVWHSRITRHGDPQAEVNRGAGVRLMATPTKREPRPGSASTTWRQINRLSPVSSLTLAPGAPPAGGPDAAVRAPARGPAHPARASGGH